MLQDVTLGGDGQALYTLPEIADCMLPTQAATSKAVTRPILHGRRHTLENDRHLDGTRKGFLLILAHQEARERKELGLTGWKKLIGG